MTRDARETGPRRPEADWIGRYFDEMLRRTPGLVPGALAGELEAGARELLVTRHSATIEVSTDLLMDYGVIPDTREHTPARLPLRWRLRRRIQAGRLRLAERVYRAIAGEWSHGPEDEDE